MKRDSGWIHTLLEEAENERMHLMTFMTLREPPIWLRALCLGAQGVFYNVFFISYMISPKTCHRVSKPVAPPKTHLLNIGLIVRGAPRGGSSAHVHGS